MSTVKRLPLQRWLKFAVTFAVATAFLFFWAYFVRSLNTDAPFTWAVVRQGLGIDPYYFGIGIQEMVTPLVLLLLFSRSVLFRRVVTGPANEREQNQLLIVFILLLVLQFFSRYAMITALDTNLGIDFVFAFVAGLLGGWRIGLLIGLLTTIGTGLLSYLPYREEPQFQLADFLQWHVLQNMNAMSSIWLGFVTGVYSDHSSPNRRFALAPTVGFALLIVLIARMAISYAVEDPTWQNAGAVAILLIFVLAAAAITLMARSVQDDVARQQAETAHLELAETNLALTQTRLALAQAELRALHAQINPHFFFNSLNTIRYFIRIDPNLARDLLTKLSEIFQRTLHAGEFVTLQEEINHTEAYLALEKARLDERLQVIWTNLAKDLLQHPVPTLILQPIVENAVIHGISPQEQGGNIHIVLNQIGGNLLLQVDDDGVGFTAEGRANWSVVEKVAPMPNENGVSALSAPTTFDAALPPPKVVGTLSTKLDAPPNDLATEPVSSGEPLKRTEARPSYERTTAETTEERQRRPVGLRNVAERLRMLYGDDYQLVIESRASGGTRVVLRIPLQPASSTNGSVAHPSSERQRAM